MEPINYALTKDDLAIMELDYIAIYDTINPSIGYNIKFESKYEYGSVNQKVRVQHADELMKRSKIICCINIKLNYMLFSTGLKLFGETISRKKDEVKSAAKRCATLEDFMIYYVNDVDYKKQLEYILKQDVAKIRGNTIYSDTFIEYRNYIVNYIMNDENPDDFVVRFIHQSDDTECKYEYETDLTDLKNYCKNLVISIEK